MAVTRFTIKGYGQVELNNVAFRRDGRIEAQCAPASALASSKIENGMFLAVDKTKKELSLATNDNLPIGLVYSAEHLYREEAMGLKDFALNATDDFLPRLGYTVKADLYTTNAFNYDTSEYATESALISALEAVKSVPMYAKLSTDGFPTVSSSAPASNAFGPHFKVVKFTTMPDGQKAIQLQVISE